MPERPPRRPSPATRSPAQRQRKPAPRAAPRGSPADLQRRLGNAGTQAMLAQRATATPAAPRPVAAPVQRTREPPPLRREPAVVPARHETVQTKLTVGPAGDAYEREADQAAQRAVAGQPVQRLTGMTNAAAPETQRMCVECEKEAPAQRQPASPTAQRAPETAAEPGLDLDRAAAAMSRSSGGAPIEPPMRARMEQSFGADFRGVRVHTDPAAQEASAALNAQAFTRGSDIYLARGQSPENQSLMAHELAHTVQQGAPLRRYANPGGTSRPVNRSPTPNGPGPAAAELPMRLAATSGKRDTTVQRSSAAANTGNDSGDVHRQPADAPAEEESGVMQLVLGLLPDAFASMLRMVRQRGFVGYLAGVMRDSFGGIFQGLRAEPGALGTALNFFAVLVTRMSQILGALASGDCAPLFQAFGELRDIVQQAASDAWAGITEFFRPVGEFFSGLWQRFGAPAVEWFQTMASDVWTWIQNLGRTLWAWTRPLREGVAALAADAWGWVKRQLFGPEADTAGSDEGGLVGWITRKANEAWDGIKATLEPVIAPVRGFAEKLMAFLPLTAILNLRETVSAWLADAAATAQNLNQPSGIVENRDTLRNEILPAILASVERLRGDVIAAGTWIGEQVGGLVQVAGSMLESITRHSILGLFSGAVDWIRGTVADAATWANTTVAGLFVGIGNGLVHLSTFLRPALDMLIELVDVAGDLLGKLGGFISGIWNRIPACIREPIERFIIDQILANIPLFGQLMQIPDIFQRIGAVVMGILRRVFVDGDLLGAAWMFFSELLALLGIPPDLVTGIVAKAATAIRDIINDPVGFFINMLRAIKGGFEKFFGNILGHLLTGATNWLLGELRDAGIQPPADLTLRSVLTFVLQVLGITVDTFFTRLAIKIGQAQAQRIRQVVDTITGALSWVVRLVTEGPGAIWEEIQGQLSNLWDLALNAVIGWLQSQVIERAITKVVSMLDPTGVMAVVNSIIALWNAVQSFVRYAREILEVVNTVLDGVGGIARGAIEAAAGFLETGLVRILPIAIGFLANQVGLSGLGRRIGEMIEAAREKVVQAFDWLIDRGRALFDRIVSGVQAAVGAVREWWRRRMQVGRGDNAHTLYFEGSEDDAELYIESRKTVLARYVAGLKGDPAYQEDNKQQALTETETKIDVIRGARRDLRAAKQQQNDPLIQQHATTISDSFDIIGEKLTLVFTSDDSYGSQDDPIKLNWPGPSISQYPTLYFGGRLPATKRPRSQEVLKEMYDKGEVDETNTRVEQFRPEAPKALPGGGPTIGVAPSFRVQKGMKIGPLSQESTAGGDALGNLIIPYGFSGENAGLDLDHIIEIQFGGLSKNDKVENLWPLDSSANRSKGSLLSRAQVDYPRGHTASIATLKITVPNKDFWFEIDNL